MEGANEQRVAGRAHVGGFVRRAFVYVVLPFGLITAGFLAWSHGDVPALMAALRTPAAVAAFNGVGLTSWACGIVDQALTPRGKVHPWRVVAAAVPLGLGILAASFAASGSNLTGDEFSMMLPAALVVPAMISVFGFGLAADSKIRNAPPARTVFLRLAVPALVVAAAALVTVLVGGPDSGAMTAIAGVGSAAGGAGLAASLWAWLSPTARAQARSTAGTTLQ